MTLGWTAGYNWVMSDKRSQEENTGPELGGDTLRRTARVSSDQHPEIIVAGRGAIVATRNEPIAPFTAENVAAFIPERQTAVGAPTTFTAEKLAMILNEICNTGVAGLACVTCGVGVSHFRRLRAEHEELQAITDEAMSIYHERLRYTIHNKAVDGWEEPVFYKGEEVGSVHKFSERMLEMQAKRHMPEYRDKSQMDVNVAGGVLVVHAPVMSREEWLKQHESQEQLPDGNTPKT